MSLFDSLASIFRAPLKDGEKVVLAQKEIESNQNVLIDKMLHARAKLDPADLQWFSNLEVIDLGTAHTNKQIWNRGGRGLFVTYFNGTPAYTKIRFNAINTTLYEVRNGYIKGAFKSIYLTNTAQAGKTLKFVVGYRNFADFGMIGYDLQDLYNLITAGNVSLTDIETWTEFLKLNSLRPPTLPVDYMVTITNADQEYSQVLASGTEAARELRFNLANFATFRYAWVTGKVAAPAAPYITVPANTPVEFHNIALYAKTLYFADSVGGQIMCISTMEDSP